MLKTGKHYGLRHAVLTKAATAVRRITRWAWDPYVKRHLGRAQQQCVINNDQWHALVVAFDRTQKPQQWAHYARRSVEERL